MTIHILAEGHGERVRPDLADYDGVSAGWTETEHQARLPGSRAVAAFWTGEPGWVDIRRWPYHEVCVMLTGRVAVTEAGGERREFGAGDAFVIPRGFSGRWETLTPTTKVFVGVPSDTGGDGHRGTTAGKVES